MQTDAVVPPPGCMCIKSCRVETSRGAEDPVTQFEPRRKAIGLQIDIGLWSSADQCSLAAERGIECYLQIVLKNQFLIMCCAVMKRIALQIRRSLEWNLVLSLQIPEDGLHYKLDK